MEIPAWLLFFFHIPGSFRKGGRKSMLSKKLTRGRTDFNPLSIERIRKRQPNCPQRQIFVTLRRLLRIYFVAHDWKASRSEMHADLMRSPCMRPGLDQRAAIDGLNRREMCLRRFGFLAVHFHFATGLWIGSDAESARPFPFLGYSRYHRQIEFFHGATFEQSAITRNGSLTFREHQNSRGIGIEAMYEFQKSNAPGTCPKIARCNRRCQRRLQITICLLPGERHQHPAARFVDGENRPILVKDRYLFARRKFDMVRFCHNLTLKLAPLQFPQSARPAWPAADDSPSARAKE